MSFRYVCQDCGREYSPGGWKYAPALCRACAAAYARALRKNCGD